MGQCFTIYQKHKLEKTDDSWPPFNLNGLEDWAKIVNVYDGDTFRATVFIDNRIRKYTFRSLGYDSPEMKPLKTLPNRDSHKERAIKARDYLRSLILDKVVFLRCSKNDKYGRVLANVYLDKKDTKSINQLMIENNHGVPYDGGKKTLI
jgi:endonuclease YncB( thermonuclease family)